MTKEEYQAELKTLQEGLEGKTADQIKVELKSFEEKYNDYVELKAKELIGEELKTFKATLDIKSQITRLSKVSSYTVPFHLPGGTLSYPMRGDI